MVMTVQMDTEKKVITSIAIKNKDLTDLKLTLSPTDGVSITIPKASPDILSSDAVKKYPYFSYDFDHLTNAGDMVKYGACYNYEKYKDLMPPEAIKTCETLQKR
jgi:hypothetical protein